MSQCGQLETLLSLTPECEPGVGSSGQWACCFVLLTSFQPFQTLVDEMTKWQEKPVGSSCTVSGVSGEGVNILFYWSSSMIKTLILKGKSDGHLEDGLGEETPRTVFAEKMEMCEQAADQAKQLGKCS